MTAADVSLFLACFALGFATLVLVFEIRRYRRLRRGTTVVMLGPRVIGSCEMIEVPVGASLTMGLAVDQGPNAEMIVRAVTLSLEWNDGDEKPSPPLAHPN